MTYNFVNPFPFPRPPAILTIADLVDFSMSKRTSPDDLNNWDDAVDIDRIVHDKRSGKRATPAKARRRNRRYQNRLLNSQLEHEEEQ